MTNKITLAATASLALVLAACDDGADVDDAGVEDPAMTTEEIIDADTAYPVGGELDADQQARMDAMDVQATSDEYDRNRDAMMREGSSSTGGSSMTGTSDDAMMSGDDAMMSGSDMGNGDMASSGDMSSDGMQGLRPRGQMDFAFLDRNSDGELSVAEYAIWAVPANPRTETQNDELGPHLTPEQINEAGTTFFYFDEDGDSYLSESEFMSARNSARTP